MEMPYNPPAPQGWQCPICKRVYSPTTPFCYYCGNEGTVSGVQTVPKGIEFDWAKHVGPMYISTARSGGSQKEQLHYKIAIEANNDLRSSCETSN